MAKNAQGKVFFDLGRIKKIKMVILGKMIIFGKMDG